MAGHPDPTSFLSGQNTVFLAHLFADYLKDPSSIDPSWALAFKSLDDDALSILKDLKGASWAENAKLPEVEGFDDKSSELAPALTLKSNEQGFQQSGLDSIRALMLIRAYRVHGHLGAHLDPLQLEKIQNYPELNPAVYGFQEDDFDRPIALYGDLGLQSATLREIWAILQTTYQGSIGNEFMHIQDPDQRAWLQERIEDLNQRNNFTLQEQKEILKSLIQADAFENFLHHKYPGAKRFGLEGAESTIVALHQILNRAGQLGMDEVILGMAHRGRLNVMANVINKPCRHIFNAFQGGPTTAESLGSGDVKYHLGWSNNCFYGGKKIHISLIANPSHLEAVNSVVLGNVRAKQAFHKDESETKVIGLLLHGDAAMAGQGSVTEALSLAELKGYRTGGTIHLIINNQIGFTTTPQYSRSSTYSSDVAKIIQAPIFHVNGDDPEAVAFVSRLAIEFWKRFQKDVVIDIFCYRRNGHNEIDDPSFTQPLMYKAITQQIPVLKKYSKKLVTEGLLSDQECQTLQKDYEVYLRQEFEAIEPEKPNSLEGTRSALGRMAAQSNQLSETGVEIETLQTIGKALTHIPQGFASHQRLEKLLKEKAQKLESQENIDWATAEALAFGSLLCEGYPVRLSGQDSRRGTFSQRHAVFVDQQTEATHVALNHIIKDQAKIEVVDSPLSEAAIMGFEYGYSLEAPKTLVLWEAQFGDFANGAQVIIDQFLCAGEAKWLRMSGLVLLLPHGYEGQGPEHSSARLERYLQLCGEDNWQVVNCSTPANYFHVLRRQLHRNFRKPLVVMTPKSLLRHRLAVSSFQEMGPGSHFMQVIGEIDDKIRTSENIKKVILCSGKVYYDLLIERQKQNLRDIAIIRLEQLYPFPKDSLAAELAFYPNAEIVWCQEEPENMGAWQFVDRRIEEVLINIRHTSSRSFYVGRKAAASTATGYLHRHEAEQKQLIEKALSSV